jgi:predicted transcriptional regulator of viral defense system
MSMVMKMLYTHKELKTIYKSDYQIKRKIAEGKIHKISRGIYSSTPSVHPMEIITKKYPSAIFTMDSAFYFHGLTDVIPRKIHLAMIRTSNRRIADCNIVAIYVLEKYIAIGKTKIDFDGVRINIYDKERMLIELVRSKKRLAFDYYKEIINSYRKIVDSLDIRAIEDYAKAFDTEEYIFKTIQEEVF